MKKLWFRAKTYGWGWYPASWQGWAVLAAYAAAMVWVFRRIDAASHSVSDTLYGIVVPFAALTAALIAVCYMTGERPGWRWGQRKK